MLNFSLFKNNNLNLQMGDTGRSLNPISKLNFFFWRGGGKGLWKYKTFFEIQQQSWRHNLQSLLILTLYIEYQL